MARRAVIYSLYLIGPDQIDASSFWRDIEGIVEHISQPYGLKVGYLLFFGNDGVVSNIVLQLVPVLSG